MKIVGDPKCPLCGRTSTRDDAFFPERSDGLSVDPVDSLFHCPGLHWECYLAWPGRSEFAKRLFDRLIAEIGTHYGRAYIDDRIAVYVFVANRQLLALFLAETGRRLHATTDDWERWQLDPRTIAPHCHPVEREALHRALVPVWERFPNVPALIAGTDWSGSERHLYV